jgi:hypothetical protein
VACCHNATIGTLDGFAQSGHGKHLTVMLPNNGSARISTAMGKFLQTPD